jgi:hypothetical protein
LSQAAGWSTSGGKYKPIDWPFLSQSADTQAESIFQQRLKHRPALRLSTGRVGNRATRKHVEALGIEPCGSADDFVDDALWLSTVRQHHELAHGRIHGFESVRAESRMWRRERSIWSDGSHLELRVR